MIYQLEPGHGDQTFPILDIVPADYIPQVGSAFCFTVSSWSMFPTIQKGDVLTIAGPVSPGTGDVVVFALDGALVCHRVVGVEPDGTIRTRGDASARDDAPIRQRDVIGRVTTIRRGFRRFEPGPTPARVTKHDRLRMTMIRLRTSAGERFLSIALALLSRLKRSPSACALAKLALDRHVRFYLGVRAPLQFVHAYRFVPLSQPLRRAPFVHPSPPDCPDRSDRNDLVIQARLGRHHLGTFHPSSNTVRLRRAAEGFGLDESFHSVFRSIDPACLSLDPR